MQMLKALGSADNCKPWVNRCCRMQIVEILNVYVTNRKTRSKFNVHHSSPHIYTHLQNWKNISTARNVNQFTSIIQLSFDNFSSRADQINNEQTFRGYITARTPKPDPQTPKHLTCGQTMLANNLIWLSPYEIRCFMFYIYVVAGQNASIT